MRKAFLLTVVAALLAIAQPAAASHGQTNLNPCGLDGHRSDTTRTQQAGAEGRHVSVWAHDDGYVAVSFIESPGGVAYVEVDGSTNRVEFTNRNGGTSGRVGGENICLSLIGNLVQVP